MTFTKTASKRTAHIHFAALVITAGVQGVFIWQAEEAAMRPVVLPPSIEEIDAKAEVERILSRFPGEALAKQGHELANAHWRWCKENACLNTDRPWFAEYLNLADKRDDAWRYLVSAYQPNYCATYRLECLHRLEEHIGRLLYEAGVMPHPMPCMDGVVQ